MLEALCTVCVADVVVCRISHTRGAWVACNRYLARHYESTIALAQAAGITTECELTQDSSRTANVGVGREMRRGFMARHRPWIRGGRARQVAKSIKPTKVSTVLVHSTPYSRDGETQGELS